MFPIDGLSPVPMPGNLEVTLRTDRREETFYGSDSMGWKDTPTVYSGKRDALWAVSYNRGVISFHPPTGKAIKVLEVTNVRELSACFDKYMMPTIAYVRSGETYLYYYDPFIRDFATRNISELAKDDITTPRLCFDDRRIRYRDDADVVLAYYVREKLCIRTSRDEYIQERVIRLEPGAENYLEQVAMGDNNRLHFETYTLVDPE